MFLTELFDTDGSYEKERSGKDHVSYSFTAGGISYYLEAEVLERLSSSVELPAGVRDTIKDSKLLNVEFMAQGSHKDLYGILGSGNAVEVFGTVIKILREIVREFEPSYLVIGAREPSRQKLYRRLLKRFGKSFIEAPDNYPKKGAVAFLVRV